MIKITFGFTFGGINYGWYKKELYRLPGMYGKNYLLLKKLNPISVGNNKGYIVGRKKKSVTQLLLFTEEIAPIFINIQQKHEDLPF